jgi:predicted nuclease of predicted toxin-antitoxin system
MKLLLDQGLPRSAADALREVGIDAVHVGDIGMAAALDEQIIARAHAEGRVVVTLDADFHAILALTGATAPSVIRLRVEGLRGAEVARRIRVVLGACEADLAAGAVVSADMIRVRLKRLPIGR